MKNSAHVGAMLVAALALAGCATLTSADPEAVKRAPMSAETTQIGAENARQAWANDTFGLFLDGRGNSDPSEIAEGMPENSTRSWSSPEPGVLNVTIRNGKWQRYDLMNLGDEIMTNAGPDTPELRHVYVSTEDGNLAFDYLRAMTLGLD